MELHCFQIISSVGSARSCYIEAIQHAKVAHFHEAQQAMKQGLELFHEGHCAHAKLIQQEASGNTCDFSLLLVHAEDQLMSAEAFGILAQEFIDLYEIIKA